MADPPDPSPPDPSLLAAAPIDGPIADAVAQRIRRRGPIPFAEVTDLALYDPEHGFYASGGAAGRRGDFLTSPEVGPLFGAVLARALDTWWTELGHPDPFVVIEAAAGSGTLARSILAAAPACLPALTYLLVEQSPALRARQGEHLPLSDPTLALPPRRPGSDAFDADRPDAGRAAEVSTGPRFVALADLPVGPVTGIVLVNELLDNLPVRIVTWAPPAWAEIRVGLADDDATLIELAVPADDTLAAAADRALPLDARSPGARLPIQTAAHDWVRGARAIVETGRLVVIDYGDTTPGLAARPMDEWLRTYREHQHGGPALADLGLQDVTCEVAFDQLPAGATVSTQAAFLRAHGLEDLVAEGRAIWHERAAIGDLAAMKARSRVREAEALVDPTGLGAFTVLEWPAPHLTS